MRLVILIGFLFINQSNSLAQQVNWISFEELSEKMRTEVRPILIFIHTDWCKFCAMQESKTFADAMITKSLNEKYYALKLNAEDKEPITFLGKMYRYKPSGAGSGQHELAVLLGKENGVLNFPTTVFLSTTWVVVLRKSGFINSQDLLYQINTIY